jgi:hypothetical protein
MGRTPNRLPNYLKMEDITDYAGSCRYLIYVEGTYYYEVDELTGKVLLYGTDASTVIQDALNRGGSIHLLDGTYDIKTKLEVYDNTTLSGTGFNTILKRNAALLTTNIIENEDTTSGNSDIEIRNLAVNGNDAAHADTTAALYLQKVTNGVVNNLFIYDTGHDGIKLVTCDHCEVTNIIADNTGNHAVFFGYKSLYCLLDGLISTDPGTEHFCLEWTDGGSYNQYVVARNIVGSGALNHGIYIQHAYHCVIADVSIYNTTHMGVYILNADDIIVNNVVVNTTTANDSYCFFSDTTTTHVVFNNCSAINSYSSGHPGFQLQGSDITLSNSLSDTCYRPAAFIAATSDHIHVYGNTFVDIAQGIVVNGDYISIHDNLWLSKTNAPSYCIYGDSYTNVHIADNQLLWVTTGDKIQHFAATDDVHNKIGWVTENTGATANVADGATINHGCGNAPIWVTATGSVAGEIITVTAIAAATFTVAIKTHAGAGGTAQTIYWKCGEYTC